MISDKFLGCGVGFRPRFTSKILENKSNSDWYEAISENYFGVNKSSRSPNIKSLLKIRENKPVALHGVSLNIGSSDSLNWDYLKELKQLSEIIKPVWHSDHLCWTGVGSKNLSDLMPLPYTQEAVDHVVSKIDQVQSFLGQEILIENVSSYIQYKNSQMTEAQFISEIANKSGCYLLLDINNVFVSAFNHGLDAVDYLEHVPHERVRQIHLAGPEDNQHYMIDTHDQPVRDEVWALYEIYVRKFGRVSTIIERDGNFPELQILEEEVRRAKRICGRDHSEARRDVENTI